MFNHKCLVIGSINSRDTLTELQQVLDFSFHCGIHHREEKTSRDSRRGIQMDGGRQKVHCPKPNDHFVPCGSFTPTAALGKTPSRSRRTMLCHLLASRRTDRIMCRTASSRSSMSQGRRQGGLSRSIIAPCRGNGTA